MLSRLAARLVAELIEVDLTLEQRPDLRLTEAAVTAGGADATDASSSRPPRHRLRVYPEKRRDLTWGE